MRLVNQASYSSLKPYLSLITFPLCQTRQLQFQKQLQLNDLQRLLQQLLQHLLLSQEDADREEDVVTTEVVDVMTVAADAVMIVVEAKADSRKSKKNSKRFSSKSVVSRKSRAVVVSSASEQLSSSVTERVVSVSVSAKHKKSQSLSRRQSTLRSVHLSRFLSRTVPSHSRSR